MQGHDSCVARGCDPRHRPGADRVHPRLQLRPSGAGALPHGLGEAQPGVRRHAPRRHPRCGAGLFPRRAVGHRAGRAQAGPQPDGRGVSACRPAAGPSQHPGGHRRAGPRRTDRGRLRVTPRRLADAARHRNPAAERRGHPQPSCPGQRAGRRPARPGTGRPRRHGVHPACMDRQLARGEGPGPRPHRGAGRPAVGRGRQRPDRYRPVRHHVAARDDRRVRPVPGSAAGDQPRRLDHHRRRLRPDGPGCCGRGGLPRHRALAMGLRLSQLQLAGGRLHGVRGWRAETPAIRRARST